MLPVCCARAAGDAQVSHVAEENGAPMDVASLRELYNRSKETQKRQTRVLLSGKASKKEYAGGKPLVNMVPISQEVRNSIPFEEEMPVKRIQFNLAAYLDSDTILWRTHLGMRRMSYGAQSRAGAACGERADGRESTRMLARMECREAREEATRAEKRGGTLCERKCGDPDSGKPTGPTTVSRQLMQSSLPGNQSRRVSSSSEHYPFPQRKWQKKSEAARSLGMYSVTGQQ